MFLCDAVGGVGTTFSFTAITPLEARESNVFAGESDLEFSSTGYVHTPYLSEW